MEIVQRVPPVETGFLMTRSHHYALDLPSGPPPEVMDEIEAAWGRAQALAVGELVLHFEADAATHRAYSELRRPGGPLERRLRASEALAIACGDPVEPRAPALAV